MNDIWKAFPRLTDLERNPNWILINQEKELGITSEMVLSWVMLCLDILNEDPDKLYKANL